MRRVSLTAVRRIAVAGTVALLPLGMTRAPAHELSETGATIIVREGGQVELRLQVPWADVLHAQWMPDAPMQEFLVRTTNQNAATFARDLARIEQSIERATRLGADRDAPATFSRWRWPSPAEVQNALRDELMSRVADGARFTHRSRLPAGAELTVGRAPVAVRLQLPVLLGPALLTVYRPTEQWLEPGQWSAPADVQRRPRRPG